MNWRVPLSDLDFGVEEEQAVIDVLRSKWLTMGERTKAFEEAFKPISGTAYAFAVSNCTAALHMAVKALDIGAGDEVILPSLTFVATSNAVLYEKATPVFADIVSLDSPLLDPDDVERKITPKTKAIIAMHYAGYPCDMERLSEIAKRHNLFLIEDAAHSPGAVFDEKEIGCWGDISCFSFFSNKNLAVGEGGMVCTNDTGIAEKLRLLRSHGMTTITLDRHQGRAWSYDVVEVGYNYRIDEIRAAIGLVQLAKLVQNNQTRAEITQALRERLRSLPVRVPFTTPRGNSTYHIFPIVLPMSVDRESFMKFLKDRGVQSSIHYPPIHKFSNYAMYSAINLPITEEYAAREVTLPLYPGMTVEQMEIVTTAVSDFFLPQK